MKARTFMITVGAALALVAQAAAADTGTTGNALHCAVSAKPVSGHVHLIPRFGSPLNPRGLQAVVVGEWVRASQPIRTGCGGEKQLTVTPHQFQVQRDSL